MPPRFVYWTILIDGKPTAFRAHDKQELLPTVAQLKRTNQDVVVKWFARGKLWDSPEAELAAQYAPVRPMEKRSRDWRPGGTHQDPRDRFKKKNRPERAWSEEERDRDQARRPKPADLGRPPRREGGWTNKPLGQPRGDRRPWSKPSGPSRGDRPSEPSRNDRPWQTKPTGPRADRKPWSPKPSGPPRNDRPWQTKPTGPRADRKPWSPKPSGPPRTDRKPWSPKPSGPPRNDRPWQTKPTGPRTDRKPWSSKPRGAGAPRGDRKPWQDKASGSPRSGEWQNKPSGPPRGGWQGKPRPPFRKKKRDDDPDKR